ncbi:MULTISPECIES: LysE family translocator [Desulfosediminicola]|uniref:LysE family translocator n=1 Tax=Desulfosediminicola TaxID=2886823 RepID=UPI0010AD977A|nr:LysE family translocator [Desulfosediminicola ganghwensis]
MDLHTFATCLVAVTLLTLTPGLDTMLIIRNSARGGWRDGAVSSLGICSGLFVHATISALGISVLLLKTVWAFNILKLAGAIYLLWLGLTSLKRASRRHRGSIFTNQSVQQTEFSMYRSLREGFLSNVLNPKTIIFYMAFLPQFIDPVHKPLGQALIVAATHFTVAMIYQCILASMVDRARAWLQHPAVGRVFDSLTGLVMIFLGARLALEKV